MLSSTFASVSSLRWMRYALAVTLVVAGSVVAAGQADAQGPARCGGRAVTVDIGAGQSPTNGPDVIVGTSGGDIIRGRGGDDVICGRGGNDRIFGGPGDEIIYGGRGVDTCMSGPGRDTVRGCRALTRGGGGPYSIALMVENAGWLRPQEQSLTAMLQRRGHTVTPFTADARPRVNARNNPDIDLLLFSPSLTYTDRYHPAQRHSLPMLDMSKYSWYRRYVLPANNEIAGPRFSGTAYTSRRVVYTTAGVIDWDGRRAGPVRVLRSTRSTGEAPMRRAINHSTGGDARFFLRHAADRRGRSTIGVYVPAGSTITKPAPTRAQERRRTSRAPWVGLILFDDDFGDGNQYRQLTRAGRSLVEAAMDRLVTP